MTARHFAIIVEDHQPIADDLAEILRSMDCESLTVDNKFDALLAIQTRTFCFVLLDLEIKLDPQSIKGHVAHGSSLLQEIRKAHNEHTGSSYWLPILIVSGFAREVDAAVEAMKDGASDIIHKPFKSHEVCETIRRALARSGRFIHADCVAPLAPLPPATGSIVVIAIPGDLVGRRVLVLVGSRPINIMISSLKVLLRLMIAHESGEHVHKRDLGAADDQGFKGISVLRDALKPALGDVDIILNDYHGNYSLADHVIITECNVEKLAKIDDSKITDLARNLQRLLENRRRKSDGNS
jgi:FixJ family two-component response regulator